jgi:hypothetical protein
LGKERERQARVNAEKERAKAIKDSSIRLRNQALEQHNARIVKRQELMETMTHFINCPQCEGNGKCIEVQGFDEYDDGTRVDRGYQGTVVTLRSYERDVESGLILNNKRQYDDCSLVEHYSLVTCPYCGGKGKAYARFILKTDVCGSCHGTKKVQVKRKSYVGIENVEIDCESCNGSGEYKQDLVHFLYLHNIQGKDIEGFILIKYFDGKSLALSNTRASDDSPPVI